MQFLEKLKGTNQTVPTQIPSPVSSAPSNSVPDSSEQSTTQWKDHPVYSKFFRLVHMGMPIDNVKMKMEIMGLDGSILEYLEYLVLTG